MWRAKEFETSVSTQPVPRISMMVEKGYIYKCLFDMWLTDHWYSKIEMSYQRFAVGTKFGGSSGPTP